MKWLIALAIASASVAHATSPKRGADESAQAGVAQPSGYVHLVQASDRLPKLAQFYRVTEEALREVNAELFAYNEAQTGHRMIINEPIILPMGCIIPRNATWARRADALEKMAEPTVITTPDSPASLDALRRPSGWASQYASRKSPAATFKPAAPSIVPPVSRSAQAAPSEAPPLGYGITTSDLPSPKTPSPNRHVRLSSVFGLRGFRHHKGIDIPIDENTPIAAADNGIVERTDHDFMGYGYYVIVNHGRYETRYAHLNRIMVTVGQQVKRGSTIVGLSGSTGHSTGPHLHFEVRINGEAVDPVARFLPGVQAMLAGSASAAGKNELQGGYGSLDYTFEGDKRWQLNRTW